MAKHYLAKTEPSTYSIDDFCVDQETLWDGVHNYEAINVIKLMNIGDLVYIYHSVKDKKIVGVAEIIGKPFKNESDQRYSWAVRMKFVKKVNGPTLSEIKNAPNMNSFKLVTHSRLSVMPVPEHVVKWIESQLT